MPGSSIISSQSHLKPICFGGRYGKKNKGYVVFPRVFPTPAGPSSDLIGSWIELLCDEMSLRSGQHLWVDTGATSLEPLEMAGLFWAENINFHRDFQTDQLTAHQGQTFGKLKSSGTEWSVKHQQSPCFQKHGEDPFEGIGTRFKVAGLVHTASIKRVDIHWLSSESLGQIPSLPSCLMSCRGYSHHFILPKGESSRPQITHPFGFWDAHLNGPLQHMIPMQWESHLHWLQVVAGCEFWSSGQVVISSSTCMYLAKKCTLSNYHVGVLPGDWADNENCNVKWCKKKCIETTNLCPSTHLCSFFISVPLFVFGVCNLLKTSISGHLVSSNRTLKIQSCSKILPP